MFINTKAAIEKEKRKENKQKRLLNMASKGNRRWIKEINSIDLSTLRVEDLMPAFEMIEESVVESVVRQRALLQYKYKGAKELGVILNECCPECPCLSGACPICFREYREKTILELLIVIDNPEDWRVVTLIYYSSAMDSKEFYNWNPKLLKDQLRKNLLRAGYKDMVLGQFDTVYRLDDSLWFHHFHLVTLDNKDAEKSLRKMMNSARNKCVWKDKIHKPMKVQELNDLVEQGSYLFKSMWQERETSLSKESEDSIEEHKEYTKKKRLSKKRFILSLLKMHEFGFQGVKFNFGTGRNNVKFKSKVESKLKLLSIEKSKKV